jgi:uncharacterized protein (DUF2141 family)
LKPRCAVLVALLLAGGPHAADLVVNVSGVEGRGGEVGCALFATPKGFPLELAQARQAWVPAAADASCRFAGVAPGRYAVAVVHDPSGRRQVTTNAFGAPTMAWGVSNGVRPLMRAPAFDESALEVAGDTTIAVTIAR